VVLIGATRVPPSPRVGDKVSKKGALTGGYIDQKASKLDLQLEARGHASKCAESEATSARVKTQIDEIDQQVSQALSAVERLELERTRLRQNYDHLKADTKQLGEATDRLRGALKQKQAAADAIEAELTPLQAKIAGLQAERGTSLDSQLDPGDQAELQELTEIIAQQKLELLEGMEASTKLEKNHSALKRKLDNNLKKRLNELLHRKGSP